MILALLALGQLPLPAATRMTNCDYETVDWNGFIRVRAEYCRVDKEGTITEIYVGARSTRWIIDGAQAWVVDTGMIWDANSERWVRDAYRDRVIWYGSVKTDQLACRFRGVTTIRYVFSDDSAICLT